MSILIYNSSSQAFKDIEGMKKYDKENNIYTDTKKALICNDGVWEDKWVKNIKNGVIYDHGVLNKAYFNEITVSASATESVSSITNATGYLNTDHIYVSFYANPSGMSRINAGGYIYFDGNIIQQSLLADLISQGYTKIKVLYYHKENTTNNNNSALRLHGSSNYYDFYNGDTSNSTCDGTFEIEQSLSSLGTSGVLNIYVHCGNYYPINAVFKIYKIWFE